MSHPVLILQTLTSGGTTAPAATEAVSDGATVDSEAVFVLVDDSAVVVVLQLLLDDVLQFQLGRVGSAAAAVQRNRQGTGSR